MMLIDKLVRTAEIWAQEHERSLARLATIVVNDGKLFERLGGGGSCTVATYERLMAYLRDGSNWSKPMPSEAAGLLNLIAGFHADDVGATNSVASPGNAGDVSGQVTA